MANYARRVRRVALAEGVQMRAQGHAVAELANLRSARRWLHRDAGHIPSGVRAQVSSAVAQSEALAELVGMREQLRQLWTPSNASSEQLVLDLTAWLRTAEASSTSTLREFAAMLRSVRPAHILL